MTNEQQLVNQIREWLNSPEQETSPVVEDLADRYAEVCRELNERLQRCNSYLDKGLRSEAVYETQLPPPLFETVKTLNFDEREQWKAFCEKKGLTVPPDLDTDTVERLQEECDKEEFLNPLLQKYRRLVHQGTVQERIDILHQIREHDPDNPSWAENLEPLEEERLPDLIATAESALEQNDLEEVKRVHQELTDSRNVVEPPADIVQRLESVLKQERRRQVRDTGEKLIAEISNAYHQSEFEHLKELISQWDTLCEDEDFSSTDEMTDTVAEARAWLEQEEQRREEEEKFQKALSETRQAVQSRSPDEDEIISRWRHLESFGRDDVPADLHTEVHETLSRIKRRRTQRRLLQAAGILVLLAAISGAVALFVQQRARNQKRGTAVARLETLISNGRLDKAENYLQKIRAEYPALQQSDRVNNLKKEISDIRARKKTRQNKFDNVMAKLNRIEKNRYKAEEAKQKRLLKKAADLAYSSRAEQKIERWKLDRQLYRENQRQNAKQTIENKLRTVAASVGEKRLPADIDELEKIQRKIAERRAKLAGLDSLSRYMTESQKKQRKTLDNKLASRSKEIDKKIVSIQNRAQKKEKLLAEVYKPIPDLKGYEKNIRELLSTFPDVPPASGLRKVLGRLAMYRDATALNSFELKSMPPSRKKATAIADKLKNLEEGENSIWHADLQRALTYRGKLQKVRKELPPNRAILEEIPSLRWKKLQYRAKGQDEWQTLYYTGEIHQRKKEDKTGNQYTLYWANVLQFSEESPEPYEKHTSEIFDKGLNTKQYEVKLKQRQAERKLAQNKYLDAFIKKLQEHDKNGAQPLDLFLLREMQHVAGAQRLPPLIKTQLLKFYADIAEKCVSHQPGPVAVVFKFAGSLPDEDRWYMDSLSQVRQAGKSAENRLDNLPDFSAAIRSLEISRKLLTFSLSREIRCVGYVKRTGDNSFRPVIKGGAPSEVWSVFFGGVRRHNVFRVLASRDSKGRLTFLPEVRDKLFAGQLLYAPVDDLTGLNALNTALKTDWQDAEWQWPESWPVPPLVVAK